MNASKFQKVTTVITLVLTVGLTAAALAGVGWVQWLFVWSFRFVELEVAVGGVMLLWKAWRHPEKTLLLSKAFWEGIKQGLSVQNEVLFKGVGKFTKWALVTSLYSGTVMLVWTLLSGFEAVFALTMTGVFFVLTMYSTARV